MKGRYNNSETGDGEISLQACLKSTQMTQMRRICTDYLKLKSRS